MLRPTLTCSYPSSKKILTVAPNGSLPKLPDEIYEAIMQRVIAVDYASGDKIKIPSGSISGTSYSGNKVVFNVGNGSITVQNDKGKKITITDASNKTTTQTYSGAVSGRSTMWFMEGNDNFTTNTAELSAIFRDSCSQSAIDNLSVRSDVVDLTAELATAASIFCTTEKNQ